MSASMTKLPAGRLLGLLLLLSMPACGIAFSAGTKPTSAPEKFVDADNSSHDDQLTKENLLISRAPTFGVSLVVNGKRFDAGGLPPPPIPVVLVP